MTPPKGLLMFDLDGTLIDSREDIGQAVNLMRGDYGLPPLDVATVSSYVGDGIGKLVERSLKGHAADLVEATALCSRHYMEHLHDRTVLYPGVADGLPRLHAAGYALAMISNKPARACREILAHFYIDALFGCILGGGDTEHLKPHPEPLQLAMTKLGVAPANAWMIGDHHTDIEAARRAGCNSAFLEGGMGHASHEKPTLRFPNFTAMVTHFSRPQDRTI